MDPFPIRTSDLRVHEDTRRVPGRDLGAPRHRDASKADPVVDQRACAHVHRERRQHAESKERRGDPLQVARVGEERKDIGAREREPYPGGENVSGGHGPGTRSDRVIVTVCALISCHDRGERQRFTPRALSSAG